MNKEVQEDLEQSAKLFEDEIWPRCKAWCGGGELLRMEGRPDSKLAGLLDRTAGIDGWQINTDGMRGIASRVQVRHSEIRKPYPYDTFSIRNSRDSGAKTEFEKRLLAIKTQRWIYPLLTIQAYAETWVGPVLSIGMARTSDIFDFIDRGYHDPNGKRTSNASFFVCPWAEMVKYGYKVKTWHDGFSHD